MFTELWKGTLSRLAITSHIGKLFHSTFPLISTDSSVHINLLPNYLLYKYLIGQLILDVSILNVPWLICLVRFMLIQKNKRVWTVVNKLNSINTQFQFFKIEVIAGELDFIVKHVNLNFYFVYCDWHLSAWIRLLIHFQFLKSILEFKTPYWTCVKIAKGGLNFYFSFSFCFSIFDLFSIFRTRVRVKWQRSCCHMTGHIRWHGHKSHGAKKDVEGSGRMMSYNVLNTCWPYSIHMAV